MMVASKGSAPHTLFLGVILYLNTFARMRDFDTAYTELDRA